MKGKMNILFLNLLVKKSREVRSFQICCFKLMYGEREKMCP